MTASRVGRVYVQRLRPKSLLVDSSPYAPFHQPDPHAPITVNIATLLPAATTGDLLVLIVGFSSLAHGPMTVPSGFTDDGQADQGSFEAMSISHGPYASSITFEVPADNSEIRHIVLAFRGYDATTPVTVSSIAAFGPSTVAPYPTVALPAGKVSYLVAALTCDQIHLFPKPSNINDAQTAVITNEPVPPPNRMLYTFGRPLAAGATSPFAPGNNGGDGLRGTLQASLVVNGA